MADGYYKSKYTGAQIDAAIGNITDLSTTVTNLDEEMNTIKEAVSTTQVTVDSNTSKISDVEYQAKANKNDIAAITTRLDNLEYVPISIASFKADPDMVEKGNTVSEVALSWKINGSPATLTLDDDSGESISTDTGRTGITIENISLTSDKSWTLTVKGDKNEVASQKTTLKFCNRIFWGVGDNITNPDSDFIKGLGNNSLQSSKSKGFTVESDKQYIYFCSPKTYGECSFKCGGFEGGFEAPKECVYTYSSGNTEIYYVYRSTNKLSGTIKIEVS